MGIDNVINNQDYDRVSGLQNISKMVMEKEINRLDSKKANMDSEESNKKRMILMNRSYQERQRQNLLLMFLFILIFLVCLVIVFFQERLGYTSVMMDFLLVLVIVIGGVSAYFVFLNILNRDQVDFSKINEDGLLQPNDIIDLNKRNNHVNSGNVNSISKECIGAECCTSPGYLYNKSSNMCNLILP